MEDWTEKYRPKSLDDIIGNKRAILDVINWAEEWNKKIPKTRALILSGKPGIGKTSCALALANDYGWSVIELNTSDARNSTNIKKIATAGAINETFNKNGSFNSSKMGGRKLIILDEADNLFERIIKESDSKNDLSDKGGKKAIVDTIKITSQPIILIVNDYYNLIKGSGEYLKRTCKLIKFFNPYPKTILELLKKICIKEGISIDMEVLETISERCQGDIRSAINDVQSICLNKNLVKLESLNVLGFRDREKIIFDVLRDIFKSKNIKSIRDNMMHLDEEPNTILLWLNENLINEYKDINDIVDGYNALSIADVFLGRVYRCRNYRLWAYACNIMSGGVATSKKHYYSNKIYNYPLWLRKYSDTKSNRDVRDSVVLKMNKLCNNSKNKSKKFLFRFFQDIFRNDTNFAINMKKMLNLSESEIKYLLGDMYKHKLDQILSETMIYDNKSIEESLDKDINEDNKEISKERVQQSLFDF